MLYKLVRVATDGTTLRTGERAAEQQHTGGDCEHQRLARLSAKPARAGRFTGRERCGCDGTTALLFCQRRQRRLPYLRCGAALRCCLLPLPLLGFVAERRAGNLAWRWYPAIARYQTVPAALNGQGAAGRTDFGVTLPSPNATAALPRANMRRGAVPKAW